jgi:hypothetical protein
MMEMNPATTPNDRWTPPEEQRRTKAAGRWTVWELLTAHVEAENSSSQ